MLASELHKQIALAVHEGMDLNDIEHSIIDPAPIAEDEQSALWLYAEALRERPPASREPTLVAG